MSQLDDHTNLIPITVPIGRRINEIMDEKGGAFTQRSFAPRVGLSKDTLGRIIDGDRNAKPSELQRIAEGLHISIQRLKQEDIFEPYQELLRLLDNKKDVPRALEIATKIHAVAIGITERCDATLQLARAEYAVAQYDRAHELVLESYRYAEIIYVKYQETDRLYNLLSRLLITHTARKEYSNIRQMLSRVEPLFAEHPEKQAAICFSKAMLAEQVGNMEQARENLYKSLELCQKNGKPNEIGRAENNVGYFEFKHHNYDTSKRYLESAIQHLQNDTQYQLIAVKEYVKTLLKLGETEKAICSLESTMDKAEDYPELKGKFLLLMAVAQNDPAYADAVLLIPNLSQTVFQFACKYLMDHYAGLKDAESFMKYYRLAEPNPNPLKLLDEMCFLDEEVFLSEEVIPW